MDTKLKIIFGLSIVLAFVLGLIIGKANTILLIISGVAIIGAFIGGLLVYRKNATKFKELEEKAKTDSGLADIIKNL